MGFGKFHDEEELRAWLDQAGDRANHLAPRQDSARAPGRVSSATVRARAPGAVEDNVVTGATVVSTLVGGRRAKTNASVTVRHPTPDTQFDARSIRRRSEAAARAWFLRWHPVSLVVRCVATSTRTYPMGGVKTGRWLYVVEGYVRSALTVEPWQAEIDGATGNVIAVGPPRRIGRGAPPPSDARDEDEPRGSSLWIWAIVALLLLALFAL